MPFHHLISPTYFHESRLENFFDKKYEMKERFEGYQSYMCKKGSKMDVFFVIYCPLSLFEGL